MTFTWHTFLPSDGFRELNDVELELDKGLSRRKLFVPDPKHQRGFKIFLEFDEGETYTKNFFSAMQGYNTFNKETFPTTEMMAHDIAFSVQVDPHASEDEVTAIFEEIDAGL